MELKLITQNIEKAKVGTGLDKIIKDAERFDLSGQDILRITDHKTSIMTYEELENVTSLEEIFKPHGAVVILYQTSENFGHWVALLNNGDKRLEFYDPYGLNVDEELNLDNDYNIRTHGGVLQPHLSILIKQGGYKVTYNNVRLQEMLEDVNTCGRYCAMRIRFRDISMKKFNGLLTNNHHYTPDMWISAMTLLV
jgi:hypothetical protein